MTDDVTHLHEFYNTPLGQAARRIIARRIRHHWSNVSGMDIIGLGYASPYLRMFHGEARATAALMPRDQGVIAWPSEGPYRSVLVQQTELPLRDMCTERVIVAHGLEHADVRETYLQEIWRILMPQGRVILIVPNRRGPWARLDTTPFGYGRPYSARQIVRILDKAMLQPVAMTPCLFLPPFHFRAARSAALAWERFGARLWPAFSGVIVVEALKQVYAGLRVPADKALVKKPVFVPVPSGVPGFTTT